jgi:hypothetical protein
MPIHTPNAAAEKKKSAIPRKIPKKAADVGAGDAPYDPLLDAPFAEISTAPRYNAAYIFVLVILFFSCLQRGL